MADAKHVPALDGIRGLAILLVMVFHFSLNGGLGATSTAWVDQFFLRLAGSGWVGVDVFFVLSGFLITGILLDTRTGPGYFRNFYVRRVLRIFPLYYVYLALRLLIAPLIWPELALSPGRSLLYWLYLPNWANVISATTGLVDATRPPGLFHFWSLGVEEQFYFIWPFLVWRLQRRTLLRLCVTLLLLTPLVRIGLHYAVEPEAGFVFTFGRLDALAVGAWLAIQARGAGLERLQRWTLPALGACGTVLTALFLWKGRWLSSDVAMQAVGYTAVAFSAAALLVRAVGRGGWAEWPVMRWFGRYCYGLYVFNGPISHLLGVFLPVAAIGSVFGSMLPAQFVLFLIGFALNIAFALASWRLIETPFLRLKRHFEYGRARVPSAPVAEGTVAA